VDAVPDEARHRHAAVLDLGVAEPADGLGRGVVVDNVERVPEADDRVEPLGEVDHVGLVLRLRRHVPADAGGRREGGAERRAATLLILQAQAVQVGRRHLRAHGGRLGARRLGVDHRHDLRLQLAVRQHEVALHVDRGRTDDALGG